MSEILAVLAVIALSIITGISIGAQNAEKGVCDRLGAKYSISEGCIKDDRIVYKF